MRDPAALRINLLTGALLLRHNRAVEASAVTSYGPPATLS
jgi:hypothetical protein